MAVPMPNQWLPTGPVPMGYHPALPAYVEVSETDGDDFARQNPIIQAGSLVALRAQEPGEKRKREDASVIVYSYVDIPGPGVSKFAFAIDDIEAKTGVCASLQTYGLVTAFVYGDAAADVAVGRAVFPRLRDQTNTYLMTPSFYRLSVNRREATRDNGAFDMDRDYVGYIVAVESETADQYGFWVCRIFVNTCR